MAGKSPKAKKPETSDGPHVVPPKITPQGTAREGLRKRIDTFIGRNVPIAAVTFTLVGVLVGAGSCSVLSMNGLHSRLDDLRDDVREDDDEIVDMVEALEVKLDQIRADLQAQANEPEPEASAPGDL